MAAELIILPEANQDVQEAYLWHEHRRAGLGEDFLSRVEACIQSVRRAPEMHACVLGNYRRALVRQFPYAVFYEYVENTVIGYCVFHTSQDPKKWRDRLN